MSGMTVEEAKELLNGCVRSESRDHAFGDVEVYWERNGGEVGSGYFGGGHAGVSVLGKDDIYQSFDGEAARELRHCGTEGEIGRNDETGPDDFVEDRVAPGLSIEDVRKELNG